MADLRNQTFYIEHFGYNEGTNAADQDTIRDNPDLALKADVTAYKYDTSGELQEGVNVSESDEGAYFLVTKDPYKRPITFQKSTWLKTAATDIENGNFKSGWKVYMGFLYPTKLYGQFASLLGVSDAHMAQTSGGTEVGYWNLFPVLKDTLTGYSTTYCFIDNLTQQIDGSIVNWDDDTENAGNIQYDMDEWNTSFEAPNAEKRKKLNDPALHYDELW